MCPLRHVRGNQMVVCKHWLRGLCKKGDDCEFLHKYDMERMPECYFFIKYGKHFDLLMNVIPTTFKWILLDFLTNISQLQEVAVSIL